MGGRGHRRSSIPDDVLHAAVHEVLGNCKLTGGKHGRPYNFRCPICGDSKFHKNKKRGYILYKNGSWMYCCHNECGFMPFLTFLKEYYRDVYNKIIFYSTFDKDDDKEQQETEDEKKLPAGSPFKKGELVSVFDDNETSKKALDYCVSRRIPESVYKKWFVCLKGDQFFNRDATGKYIYNDNGYPSGNEYHDRLIIPYYRLDGSWKQFDARALDNDAFLRYMNLKDAPREMYKVDFLDVSKPFFLFEGAIDATFVRNSVAFGGTKHLMSFLQQYPDIREHAENGTVIWDNDDAGRDEIMKTVNMGFRWFDWSQFKVKAKDMNDLVRNCKSVELDEEGFVKPEWLMNYSKPAATSKFELIMKYGDREKQRREHQERVWETMRKNKKSQEPRSYF